MTKSGSPSAEGSFHSKQSCRTEKGLGTIECRTGRFPKGKKHCPASDEIFLVMTVVWSPPLPEASGFSDRGFFLNVFYERTAFESNPYAYGFSE